MNSQGDRSGEDAFTFYRLHVKQFVTKLLKVNGCFFSPPAFVYVSRNVKCVGSAVMAPLS